MPIKKKASRPLGSSHPPPSPTQPTALPALPVEPQSAQESSDVPAVDVDAPPAAAEPTIDTEDAAMTEAPSLAVGDAPPVADGETDAAQPSDVQADVKIEASAEPERQQRGSSGRAGSSASSSGSRAPAAAAAADGASKDAEEAAAPVQEQQSRARPPVSSTSSVGGASGRGRGGTAGGKGKASAGPAANSNSTAGGSHSSKEVDYLEEEQPTSSSRRSMRGSRGAGPAQGSSAGTTKGGKKATGKNAREEDEDEEEDEEDADGAEAGGEGATRCVCAKETEELSSGLMIQCETCKCWQHGPCVGLWDDRSCPDRYYCELCRPGWHGPGGILRKAHRVPLPRTSSNDKEKDKESSSSTAAAPATAAKDKPTAARPPVSAGRRGGKAGGAGAGRDSSDVGMIESSAFGAAESTTTSAAAAKDQKDSRVSRSPGAMPSLQGLGLGALATDARAPKKRSTMNSRDAAYDRAIALSILEAGSGQARVNLQQEKESSVTAKEQNQRESSSVKDEEEDGEGLQQQPAQDAQADEKDEKESEQPPAKRPRLSPEASATPFIGQDDADAEDPSGGEPREDKGKGRADQMDEDEDEQSAADSSAPFAPPPPQKAKHPNQYTYRPKNGAPAPNRTAARASPVKRDYYAAGRNGLPGANGKRDWVPGDELTWGLPDHLSHLSSLLPSSAPEPLRIIQYVKAGEPSSSSSGEGAHATVNGNGHEGGGSSSSSSVVAESSTSHASNGHVLETRLEAPTRVRFPGRRMTLPEMRKRSRAVLEYVSKVQIEMSERERRSELLEKAMSPFVGLGEGTSAAAAATPTTNGSSSLKPLKPASHSESVEMMDRLSREVHLFQQRFCG